MEPGSAKDLEPQMDRDPARPPDPVGQKERARAAARRFSDMRGIDKSEASEPGFHRGRCGPAAAEHLDMPPGASAKCGGPGRARSSEGEHTLHTGGVTGSIPVAPTSSFKHLGDFPANPPNSPPRISHWLGRRTSRSGRFSCEGWPLPPSIRDADWQREPRRRSSRGSCRGFLDRERSRVFPRSLYFRLTPGTPCLLGFLFIPTGRNEIDCCNGFLQGDMGVTVAHLARRVPHDFLFDTIDMPAIRPHVAKVWRRSC
jgi:hypothetical protein